ncbi:Alpha/Beta hydrolase protein [Truncatella angustata]|uniref:Alpha/Beta hydrolase protein n=1 Tax=Truncatella angustata TaxID=152316 RepID=A0A9P8ZU76_9PEZI|nr:Alpha/Beta hydrolase protein [Truncatella angustata]KAH6651614.1 Alpha/Beta hydrolase protein [Truncatella angustata]KAH8203520.1 hypothetical protein TruAng_002268 [Truncatella angustata]
MSNGVPDAPGAPSNSSITIQTETELSLLYRVLRTVIKPLRPRLVHPGHKQPAGSPRLGSHPHSKGTFTISERQHDDSGVWLYDFQPESPPTIKIKPPTTIYYFCGGAFQSQPSREHWSFISQLAGSLILEHHFTLVSYPLAPESPASESLSILRRLMKPIFMEAAKKGDRITLMGDSAGGNIAASLGFWWAEEVATSGECKLKSVLQSIILVSPAIDLRNSNPAIAQVDPLDPLLSAAYTKSVAEAWLAAPPEKPHLRSSADDPKLSPVLHEPSSYRILADLGINVHCIYGTHDVLAPDAEVFRNKCEEHGVKGRWLVWNGQMHCFVLAGTYGMSEGKRGIEWLIEVLKADDASSRS